MNGATRRHRNLVPLNVTLGCFRYGTVEQNAGRQLRWRYAEAYFLRGRIEEQVQDRNGSVIFKRCAAHCEDAVLAIVPGLVGDDLAVRVEPLDVANTWRRLVFAMQEIATAQNTIPAPQFA